MQIACLNRLTVSTTCSRGGRARGELHRGSVVEKRGLVAEVQLVGDGGVGWRSSGGKRMSTEAVTETQRQRFGRGRERKRRTVT